MTSVPRSTTGDRSHSGDTGGTSPVDFRMPTCEGVQIEELTMPQLQRCLNDGKFSASSLVECYLERINRLNERLKAVIETNPGALDIASRLDRERRHGEVRSPIHGIPFLVKDSITLNNWADPFGVCHSRGIQNIATKDKMQTTAGSSVLAGTVVPEDAHVVSLLRDAGAILLGHANLSEWASMRSSYYSEGYSSRGGQCRNPYNLAEHPGGSSGGSAAAVSTNMCAFSLGTETDGSVIFPADRNAVVGIKPTVGLTSTRGVIPESSSLDTVGTFGRTVLDAAIALDAITGAFQSEFTMPSYASFVATKDVLKGAKFGLPWNRVWEAASEKCSTSAQYDELVEAVKSIEEAGAEVIKGTDFSSAEEIIPPSGWDWDFGSRAGHPERSEFTVVKRDFYNDINEYLSSLIANPNNIHGLEDIVAWNTRHSETEGGRPGVHTAWPSGQDNFEESLASKGVKDDTYYKALKYIRAKSREEGIDAALQVPGGSHLDGLLVPIQAEGGVACQVAAKAGYPMISIPVAVDDNGVPFGIGIIQRAWKEDLLIKHASAIEDLFSHERPKPRFRNIEADNYMYIGNEPNHLC